MSSWAVGLEGVMVFEEVIRGRVSGDGEGAEDTLNPLVSDVKESTSGCNMALELGKTLLSCEVKRLQSKREVSQQQLSDPRELFSCTGNVHSQLWRSFLFPRRNEF